MKSSQERCSPIGEIGEVKCHELIEKMQEAVCLASAIQHQNRHMLINRVPHFLLLFYQTRMRQENHELDYMFTVLFLFH